MLLLSQLKGEQFNARALNLESVSDISESSMKSTNLSPEKVNATFHIQFREFIYS